MEEFRETNNFLCYREMMKKYKRVNITYKTISTVFVILLLLVMSVSWDKILVLPILVFALSIFTNPQSFKSIPVYALSAAASIFLILSMFMSWLSFSALVFSDYILVLAFLSIILSALCIQNTILHRALSVITGYPLFDERTTDMSELCLIEPIGIQWTVLRRKIRHFKKPATLKLDICILAAVIAFSLGISTFIKNSVFLNNLNLAEKVSGYPSISSEKYISGEFSDVICSTCYSDEHICYWATCNEQYICVIVPLSMVYDYDLAANYQFYDVESVAIPFTGRLTKYDGQDSVNISRTALEYAREFIFEEPSASNIEETMYIELFETDELEEDATTGLIVTFASLLAMGVIYFIGRRSVF